MGCPSKWVHSEPRRHKRAGFAIFYVLAVFRNRAVGLLERTRLVDSLIRMVLCHAAGACACYVGLAPHPLQSPPRKAGAGTGVNKSSFIEFYLNEPINKNCPHGSSNISLSGQVVSNRKVKFPFFQIDKDLISVFWRQGGVCDLCIYISVS